jgi:type 1 glutamine amidotransferase
MKTAIKAITLLLPLLLVAPAGADGPHMPHYASTPPPPPLRTRTEVQAVLAGGPADIKTRPIRLILVAGKKDHGLGEHDYPAWQKVWKELLGMAKDAHVATADEWPTAAQFQDVNVLVFYQHGAWNPQRAKDIDAFLARGGGLVYIHWAVDGTPDSPGFAQRIGLCWAPGGKYRHGPVDLDFGLAAGHPIARNFTRLQLLDETYWNLGGDPSRIKLLASGKEDAKPQPLFWTMEPSKGRVFVSIPGHYAWTFDDPLFRILLLRGIAWTAREPIDRFNDLVLPGARVKAN